MNTFVRVALLLLVIVVYAPDTALAYGGPGSVISGIGAFLAGMAALVAALFGFIWFPLKRLYRSLTDEETPSEET
jgi:hypothetical protein